jgi:hypothetical protein
LQFIKKTGKSKTGNYMELGWARKVRAWVGLGLCTLGLGLFGPGWLFSKMGCGLGLLLNEQKSQA